MNDTFIDDDPELDAAIRSALSDIIASTPAGTGTASVQPGGALANGGRPGRQLIVIAAALALVVAGLGWIAARSYRVDAPADQTGTSPTAVSVPAADPAIGPSGLNRDGLADPASTMFGGFVAPLLPPGFELVFASDDPEPLIVALNAAGDRFESMIYSSPQRLAEADRTQDEPHLEVPEGLLTVGPDGQPGERNAYLVTDDAIIVTEYVRIADPSTIEPGSASDIARAIARDVPGDLITGLGPHIGTGMFNDVTAAVENLAERVQTSGGVVRASRAPTVEVNGEFASSNGPEPATVRVEMFDGVLAPSFLVDGTGQSDDASRQVARIGSWLVLVTVDGNVSADSSALKVTDAVSGVVTATNTPTTAPSSANTQTSPTPTRSAAVVAVATTEGSTRVFGEWVSVDDTAGVFAASDAVGRSDEEREPAMWPSSVTVADVVAHDNKYVAVGTSQVGFRAEAMVWRSADGHDWSTVSSPMLSTDEIRDPTDGYGARIFGATTNANTIVAFGTIFADGGSTPTVWVSDDATNWERHVLRTQDSQRTTVLTGIVASRAGFVAVGTGHTDEEVNETATSFLWRSADGVAWEHVEVPAFDQPGTLLSGVANLGDRLIAFGSTGGQQHHAAAWFSDDDGATWAAADVPPYSGPLATAMQRAVTTDGTVVVFGEMASTNASVGRSNEVYTMDGTRHVAAWMTTDGAEYTAVDATSINSSGHDIATAATTGTAGVLVATERADNEGPSTHLWTWTPKSGFIERNQGPLKTVSALGRTATGYLAFALDRFLLSGRELDDVSGDDTLAWLLPIEESD